MRSNRVSQTGKIPPGTNGRLPLRIFEIENHQSHLRLNDQTICRSLCKYVGASTIPSFQTFNIFGHLSIRFLHLFPTLRYNALVFFDLLKNFRMTRGMTNFGI